MKTLSRIALMVALVAGVTLLAAPAAEACCRPCQGFCDKTIPPSTPCCTGIPVPGDACGLTTCGEYLQGNPDVAVSDAAAATLPTGPQSTEEVCPEEPLFAAPAGPMTQTATATR
ncbi:MAG TPA: hypothetical protein VHQ65_01655 [Thermoanaerobaculia bacterium]|nr:hypothetical protein [Thermoanaerobaculia bacterium]